MAVARRNIQRHGPPLVADGGNKVAVWNIYRYAFFSVVRILLIVIRIWYAYAIPEKVVYIPFDQLNQNMGVHIAQRCETHTALAFKLTVTVHV